MMKISHRMQPFKETQQFLAFADENCRHRAYGRSLPLCSQPANKVRS